MKPQALGPAGVLLNRGEATALRPEASEKENEKSYEIVESKLFFSTFFPGIYINHPKLERLVGVLILDILISESCRDSTTAALIMKRQIQVSQICSEIMSKLLVYQNRECLSIDGVVLYIKGLRADRKLGRRLLGCSIAGRGSPRGGG